MTRPLTADERFLRTISEKSWQNSVLSIAHVGGWHAYHAPDNRPITSRTGYRYVQNIRAGFPDTVLVKDDRLLFAELKTETGKPTPEQLAWLNALAATGTDVALWRPSDRDLVEAVLLRNAPVPAWTIKEPA